MGIINQPTPTNPKSPQPEQQPLSPGTPRSNPNNAPSERPNVQTPDQHEKAGGGNAGGNR